MRSQGVPGHLIRRLHQHSTQIFSRRLHKAGCSLTSVQFAALDAISSSPGIDQAGVPAAISYDRATIGGVISRLEKAKLVERPISETDRRAKVLQLSEAGREELEKVVPLVHKVQEDILSGLSGAERQAFLDLARHKIGQNETD